MTSSRSEQPGNRGMRVQRIGKEQHSAARGPWGYGRAYLLTIRSRSRGRHQGDVRGDHARRTGSRALTGRAKAAARLQHRNIVTVFDFAHDGEIPYFVMEFLRGQNLSQRLRQGPPLTLARKLDLAVELCEDFISHTVKA